MTGAKIRRNVTNHSLEKKKVPGFDLFSGKNNFRSGVLALNMDSFALKVKPKKICKHN